MKRLAISLLTAGMVVIVGFRQAAAAVEVKLTVTEQAKVARESGVVTSGVPFAKGTVTDVGKLAATAAGKPIPAQFLKLVAWDDGSVRWALMDVQVSVPAGGKVELTVTDAGGNPQPAAPVKADDGKDAVTVSTGPMQFVVSKSKPGLFESLKVDGKELVTSAGRGPVIYKESGGEVPGQPAKVTLEQAGPMRTIVCVKGKFPGLHNELLTYTTRITAFAGQKFVKVQMWLENGGAMGYFDGSDESPASKNVEWFTFDGMAVELALGLGAGTAASCEDSQPAAPFKVLQTCIDNKTKRKVYRGAMFTWDDYEYTISGGGKELKKGDRTDGVVTVKGPAGSVVAAVRGFWEQYEKAIELKDTTLNVWLWPTEGQWPRIVTKAPFDKSLDNICKKGLYVLPGSVHKGHEFMLDFSGKDAKASQADLASPLFAFATAEHYASTEAAPGLFAPPAVHTGEKDCDVKIDAWVRMTRSVADPASPAGLFKARQAAVPSDIGYLGDTNFSYGWLDFGDLSIPGRGFVSLHNDWTWIALVNAIRLGEPEFMRLGTEMARHHVDIDQFWSDRDLPRMTALQRGGYNWTTFHCYRLSSPPSVQNNTIAGVVLYYMLTGEPKALECCMRNGKGLKTAWATVLEKKPYAGPQGDMAANASTMESYMALFDLTADKAWLDEAVMLFTEDVIPTWKAMGPFLHSANQIQSQDYMKTDQKYCFSIRALCMLHHATGNEKLLKLLVEATQKDFPDTFFQAPLYLADLYAYVGLTTSSKELLDKGAELMAQGFPESKCPPVYLPDNSTWSQDAAMMLKAVHILQYASWKMKK